MNSHEIFKEFFDTNGPKICADDLDVTIGWLYQWSRRKEGKRNPLDSILRLTERRKDTRLIIWLCHKAGGVFVPEDRPADNRESVASAGSLNLKGEQVANQVVLLMAELMKMILESQQKSKESSGIKHKKPCDLTAKEAADMIREHGDQLHQALKLLVVYLEKDLF